MKSSRGVSAIEYMAVAVFVILGIIIGGPYVVRSINAPVKTLEEGTIDSAREDIKQAPVDLTLPLPECDCSPLQDHGCGDGITCGKTQKLFSRTCTPLGCEVELIAKGFITVMSECRNDPAPSTCCLAGSPTGNCGPLASHIPPVGCPPGQMEMQKLCGSPLSVPVYYCQLDPACIVACEPIGSNTTGWCDVALHDVGLTGLTPVWYVDHGDCLVDPTDMRCKAECDIDSYAFAGSCQPHCPNGTCEDGTGGNPDYGETNATCPADCPISSTGDWYQNPFGYNLDPTQTLRLRCIDFCPTLGLVSKNDPVTNMHCASGENKPSTGMGILTYTYGCFPAGSCAIAAPNAFTFDYYFPPYDTIECYHIGQPEDHDQYDIVIGCFCGN